MMRYRVEDVEEVEGGGYLVTLVRPGRVEHQVDVLQVVYDQAG